MSSKIQLEIAVIDKQVTSAKGNVAELRKEIDKTGASSGKPGSGKLFEQVIDKATQAKKSVDALNKAEANVGKGGGGGNFADGLVKSLNGLESKGGILSKLSSLFGTTSEAAAGMGASTALAGEGMAGLAAAAGPVGIALAAIGVALGAVALAGYKAWQMAVDLTSQFTEHALALEKTNKETDISIERLSAYEAQAHRTGKSFDSVKSGLSDFYETLRKARNDDKDSVASLDRLGIKVKEFGNNTEGAFDKAAQKILSLPPGIDRVNASVDAFGKGAGKDMLAFIESFKGNTTELTQELRKMGVVMGEDDVRAAKEAKKAMAENDLVVKGFTMTLQRELLPTVTDVFKQFNQFLKDNSKEIREWASDAAYAFKMTLDSAQILVGYLRHGQSGADDAYKGIIGRENTRNWDKAGNEFGKTPGTILLDENGNPVPQQKTSGSYNIPMGGKGKKPDTPSLDQILEAMRKGTMAQESGGRLSIRNSRTDATGLFQVMPENIGPWTKSALGVSMTQEQFSASKSAQIAVFQHVMGGYIKRALKDADGNWEEAVRRAAVRWYGTKADTDDFAQMKRFRRDEPSRGEYSASVLRRTKAALGMKGDYVDKIGDELINSENEVFALSKAQVQRLYYKMNSTAIVPDDQIREQTKLLNKNIKLDRDKFTEQGLRDKFFPRELLPVETQQIATDITNEQNLYRERETVKLRKEILEAELDSFDLYMRKERLGVSTLNNELMILAAIEDQKLVQQEQGDVLGKQLELQQRLFGDESYKIGARDIEILRQKVGLDREIFELENQIATSGYNDHLEIQAAHLRDIVDLRNRDKDAIISSKRALLEISQGMVYSETQANAKVLEHIASQKSLTEAVADAKITIVDGFYGGIDSGLDKITRKMGIFGSVIKEVFGSIIKQMATPFLMRLFGLDGGRAANTAQRTGGGGFNLGSMIFGGGSGTSGVGFGTPAFNPNFAGAGGSSNFNFLPASSSSANSFFGGVAAGGPNPFRYVGDGSPTGSSSVLPNGEQAFNVNGNSKTPSLSMYSQFKDLFRKNPGMVQALGASLGMGLGGSLGGGSVAGNILGQAGGALGGLLVSGLMTGSFTGATGGGIFGATPGLFGLSGAATLGIGAAIAGVVMLGSYLLGRSAQRRKDEKTRDAAMVDALKQLNQIKQEMTEAKPGINIPGLVSQAEDIQKQYYEQVNALKSNKTRKIAIKDGRERVDPLVDAIREASKGAQLKEQIRSAAADRDRQIIPEFATGGYTGRGGKYEFAGIVHKDEFVMPKEVVNRMGIPALEAIKNGTGFGSGQAPVINVSMNAVFEIDKDGMLRGFLEGPDGVKRVINIVQDAKDGRKIK